MGKNSFLIYHEYAEHFEMLDDAELGQLIRAIMEYEQHQTTPNLPKHLALAFSFIKKDLDYNRGKYEERCEKNRKNAAKRWEGKESERIKENANACERKNRNANNAEHDLEHEHEYEHDKEKDIKHIAQSPSDRAKEINALFSEFWQLYPRKVAKKAAQKSYEKLMKQGVDAESILAGVRDMLAWIGRNGKEIQFVPYPSTWLNQERWNDVLVDDVPAKPPWEKERQQRERESDAAAERVKAMLAAGNCDLLGGG